MESAHEHHEMPTEGRALTGVALSATLHCLTGCAIGEVLGMVIGTALGFSDLGTIALAVSLAFLFGYTLTSIPLLRAGLALGAVIPIALASDTLSIAIMEIVDNGIMLLIPGAMESGVGDVLFWGALSFALVIAGLFALPANRWLIARGKGHTAVHETGIHGGPPVKVVGAIAAVAFVFGSAVLINELITNEGGHGGGHEAVTADSEPMHEESSAGDAHGEEDGGHATSEGPTADPVRGLAVSEDGMTLDLTRRVTQYGVTQELAFVVREDGKPVTDFETEHTKQMHFIVVRRDMTNFQHLHPEMSPDGTWKTPLTLLEPGDYRVFADFKVSGENRTLAGDLLIDGPVDWRALPGPSNAATTSDGYTVRLDGDESIPGEESELTFTITRNGEPVGVEPYLGADGHLVALREGDLAYLHTHPAGHGGEDADHADAVQFATEFPSEGRYRLFLQFREAGAVHTAAFTRHVGTAHGD